MGNDTKVERVFEDGRWVVVKKVVRDLTKTPPSSRTEHRTPRPRRRGVPGGLLSAIQERREMAGLPINNALANQWTEAQYTGESPDADSEV